MKYNDLFVLAALFLMPVCKCAKKPFNDDNVKMGSSRFHCLLKKINLTILKDRD